MYPQTPKPANDSLVMGKNWCKACFKDSKFPSWFFNSCIFWGVFYCAAAWMSCVNVRNAFVSALSILRLRRRTQARHWASAMYTWRRCIVCVKGKRPKKAFGGSQSTREVTEGGNSARIADVFDARKSTVWCGASRIWGRVKQQRLHLTKAMQSSPLQVLWLLTLAHAVGPQPLRLPPSASQPLIKWPCENGPKDTSHLTFSNVWWRLRASPLLGSFRNTVLVVWLKDSWRHTIGKIANLLKSCFDALLKLHKF